MKLAVFGWKDGNRIKSGRFGKSGKRKSDFYICGENNFSWKVEGASQSCVINYEIGK